ncbi:MAG: Fic family protein [Bacillota bacterium]|nr:Fic family protein [Bacillota bacterium]
MQNEKLYSMQKEFAGYLKSDVLLKEAIKEICVKDMIRGSLVSRNAHKDKVQIETILNGELQRDLPVKDYIFIQNFRDVIRVAFICLEMGNYLDKYLLLSSYRTLKEDETAYYRKTNPVIYAINHVPAHSLDIEDKLDDCLRRIYKREAGSDVVLKAMYIHNKIMDIYPFEEYSAELAVFAMNYYLLEQGFMPISMDISRTDYLEMVSENLKGHKLEEFYGFLKKSIEDKLEGTIEACREYVESNRLE